jgi:hypothetical protein
MTQNNNNTEKKSKMLSVFYIALSIIAVIVMIIAAMITYGYDAHEIKVTFKKILVIDKGDNKQSSNNIGVAVDTSQAPSDDIIEDILNDTIPNVCDYEDYDDLQEDCDKEPLSCLKEYQINKIFVQNPGYEDQLFIELTTGKTNDHVYTVVIDLANNNTVISASGKIDDKRCRDVEEDDNDGDDNLLLDQGEDPRDSDYVDTKPKE